MGTASGANNARATRRSVANRLRVPAVLLIWLSDAKRRKDNWYKPTTRGNAMTTPRTLADLLLAVLALVCAAAIPASAQAAILKVPTSYATIQAAVNAAHDGDIIRVSPGTYPEQVVIRNLNRLSVVGYGATISVPASPPEMEGPLVKIVNCENFRLTGFKIDGKNGANVNYGDANAGGDADTRFYGLLVVNSSGQVANNAIVNVSLHNDLLQGVGLYAQVTDGVARRINILENLIDNFQKVGIAVSGPIQAKIQKNIISHWGESGITVAYGIQVDGGTASITGNVITGVRYYDEEHSQDASSGMLLIAWQYPGDNWRVVNNTVKNCDIGIWLFDYEGDDVGVLAAKVINNKFGHNIVGDILVDGAPDTKVHATKYE